MAGWRLESVAPVTMHRTNRLANMYVLSPFVWREGQEYRVLVRAVPRRDDEPRLKMAEIWHGVSVDGLHFIMDEAPVIFPGPDLSDLDGCEDPTVLRAGDEVRVWYTGYNDREKTGRLMLARGPDCARLAKAGLAIDSTPAYANPKEASVAPIAGDRWRMWFEFAREGASLIGQADADDLDGPWDDARDAALQPRQGSWDCWHLSPGPIIGADTEHPTMFYNGATRDAKWRIGWATFNSSGAEVADRCIDPLVAPNDPITGTDTDIAFIGSAVEQADGSVQLYYSLSDQHLRCATVRKFQP